MAALTAARNTPAQGGDSFMLSIALKANAKVWKGGLVMVDTTGYGVAGVTGATTNISMGVATTSVDNTGGASGAVSVTTVVEQAFLMNASGLTQACVGAPAYFVDDNTVTTSPTTSSKAGVFIQFVSATQAWVYIGVPR